MPTLQADLDLELNAALSRLGELDDAFEQSANRFGENLAAALEDAFASARDRLSGEDLTVPVQADTTAAEAALGGVQDEAAQGAELTIGADTSSASSAIAQVKDEAEGEEIDLQVNADTSDADASLQELTDQAGKTTEATSQSASAMDSLKDSTTALSGVVGVAVGNVSGLEESTHALGGSTAAAAGGAFILGAGISLLARAGLDAKAAEEQYNATLGETKDAVEAVKVGDLNTDLFTLTKRMGSTDSATKTAASSIFQFATNAGAGRSESAQFTDQLFVLAARAVALKPQLGDVSDVASSMAVGLGRARTAAQQYGIAISQAEINQRALQDTGKQSAADLTAYEKSVAGAELALERYGTTLKETVQKGSQNAAIEQRRLSAEFHDFLEEVGKPLVSPGLKLVKEAIPDAEQLARALAQVGQIALPIVSAALQVAGPLIQPFVFSIVALEVALRGAALANTLFGGSTAAAVAGMEAETEAAVQTGLATSVLNLSFAQTAGVAAAGAVAFGVTTAALHSMFDPVDLLTGVNKKLDESVQSVTKSVGTGGLTGAFHSLVDEERRAASAAALQDAFGGSQTAVGALSGSIADLEAHLSAFRRVATASIPAAQAIIDQTAKGTKVYDAYGRILQQAIDKQAAQAAAQQKASTVQSAATDRANVALGQQKLLTDQAAASATAFAQGTGSASQALNDEQAALKESGAALSLYQQKLDSLLGIHIDEAEASLAFANSLEGVSEAVGKNGATLGADTQGQRDNLEALISSAKAADSLAQATFRRVDSTDGAAAAQKAANDVLASSTTKLRDAALATGLDAGQVDVLLRQLGLLTAAGAPTALSIDSWGQAASESAPKVEAAGQQVGSASAKGASSPKVKADHKEAGLGNIAAYVGGVVEARNGPIKAAGDAASAAVAALNESDPSFEAAGNAAADAVSNGYTNHKNHVIEAAAKSATDAVAALHATEPQFEAQGNALAAGTGIGVKDGAHFIGEGILAASQGALGVAKSEDHFWHDLGVSWAGGVAQGITDGGPTLDQAAIDAINSANTSSQAYLKSHSPSQRTRDEIGLPFSQGIAVGIAAGAPLVTKAALGAVSGAVVAAVPRSAVGSSAAPAAGAPGGVLLGVGSGAPLIGHVTIQPPTPDPVGVAQRTATTLRARLFEAGFS